MPPPATLAIARRLWSALAALADAIEPAVAADPGMSVVTLAVRLATLMTALLKLTTTGIRRRLAPAGPALALAGPAMPPSAPQRLPTIRALRLDRRRLGWLLPLLPAPDAPAIAAGIGIVLADPALAALLHEAPTFQRRLRPILRALGLALPTPAEPPAPEPPPATPTPEPPSSVGRASAHHAPATTPHPVPPPSPWTEPTQKYHPADPRPRWPMMFRLRNFLLSGAAYPASPAFDWTRGAAISC